MTPQRLAHWLTRRELLQYSAKAALAYPAFNFATAAEKPPTLFLMNKSHMKELRTPAAAPLPYPR
jgi:hypothetical protein